MQDEELSISKDPAIICTIAAVKRILKRYKQQKIDLKDSKLEIHPPIKILFVLLTEANEIIEPTTLLSEITVDLIKFIKHFLQDSILPSDKLNNKIKTESQNLFESISDDYKTIWDSLAALLREQVVKLSECTEKEEFKIEAIDIFMFTLNNIFPKADRTQTHQEKQKKLEEALSESLDEIIPILLKNMDKITDRQ